jgi:hypothetical protein
MAMSTAQKIGVGVLLGGVASIGTSMLLRYFADNKGKNTGTAAAPVIEYPIWWEHAPLVGILGGAAATVLTYYMFGKSAEAAVACGAAALIAGVAPEADAWVTEARSEADLAAPAAADCPAGQTKQADGTCAGACDVVDIRSRVAALESSLEEFRNAA